MWGGGSPLESYALGAASAAHTDGVSRLPDPSKVRTRVDFVDFVEALVSSLDAAMLQPEPGPWVDDRGGWTNWTTRWAFWEAMTGWLSGRRQSALQAEPIGSMLLDPVPEPSQGASDDTAALRAFLVAVRDWAASSTPDGSPSMWRRAAEAMTAGAEYE